MAYARRDDRGGSYGGGNKFGGNKSFGGPSRGGFGGARGGDRGDRPMMHEATCASCGSACTVPFKPNGRKPVLCGRCFGEAGGNEREPRNDSPRFEKPAYVSRPRREAPDNSGNSSAIVALGEQLRTINAKLDQILKSIASEEM